MEASDNASPKRSEAELLPLLRKLGIGLVLYSPLGHGFLTGQIRSPEQLADDDWRKTNPRFTGENFERNLRILHEVAAVGSEGATPAQVALAWLLAPGDDIAPILASSASRGSRRTPPPANSNLSAKQIERAEQPHSGRRRAPRRSADGHHPSLSSRNLAQRAWTRTTVTPALA